MAENFKDQDVATTEPIVTPAETEIPAKPAPKKVLWLGLGVALVLAVLIVGAVTVFGVYNASENPFVVKTASALRLSVAKVNGESIPYRDYVSDLQSLRTYYATQPSGSPYNKDEQSDQVLSRLIANSLVAQVARDLDINVTEEEREAAHKDVLARFENNEAKLAEDVKKNLGVELNEFYERILEPTLLEKKVAEQFATSTDAKFKPFDAEQVRARHILFTVADPKDDAKVKAQAEKVLGEIKKGADFAAKAKQYGTDGTKDAGGDLGWFGRGDMVKEFEETSFALKPGELATAPIKTEFGYHLIKVEEKRTARDFSSYMNEKLRTATIDIFGKVHNPFANLQAQAQPQIEVKQ